MSGAVRAGHPRFHAATAWLFAAGLVVQTYLAGIGLFAGGDFSAHRQFVGAVWSLALILFLGAALGGVKLSDVSIAAVLVGAAVLQAFLPGQRQDAPLLAALHPLLGSLLLAGALGVAVQASRRAVVQARSQRDRT